MRVKQNLPLEIIIAIERPTNGGTKEPLGKCSRKRVAGGRPGGGQFGAATTI